MDDLETTPLDGTSLQGLREIQSIDSEESPDRASALRPMVLNEIVVSCYQGWTWACTSWGTVPMQLMDHTYYVRSTTGGL